jgi:hypothetical protein
MFGLNDLEIEGAVLDLVAPEVLGAEESRREQEEEKGRGDATEHNDLDLGRADQQLGCIVPEPLELVEGARLRVKQVDHEIHEIEQYPASAVESLDVVGVMAPAIQLLHHRFRDATDVSIGRAGGNDEIVGCIIQAAEIEHHELIAFEVQDSVQRQAKRLGRLGNRPPVWCILNHLLVQSST